VGWQPTGSTGGGGSGVTSFNTRTGTVTLSNADVATILAAFTSSADISLTQSGGSGIQLTDNGGGGIELSSTGVVELNATGPAGIELSGGGGPTFETFTAANLAGLPTPVTAPGLGITPTGIYLYPTGGPWQLAGGGGVSTYPVSTITADPAPGVVGTYYRANYAASGNFTLPTGPATGSAILIEQIAGNVLTVVGTIAGVTNLVLNKFQSALLIYNGTTWDLN
jgi:hypothetical protein